MHKTEAAAVERGNMFLSRGRLPPLRRRMKPLMNLFRLRKRDRVTPDLFLKDGDRLGIDSLKGSAVTTSILIVVVIQDEEPLCIEAA